MSATDESIVKADRRGRLRYTTEQKAALVEAYQASGLSGPRFAQLHGVNYQTLASWLQAQKGLRIASKLQVQLRSSVVGSRRAA